MIISYGCGGENVQVKRKKNIKIKKNEIVKKEIMFSNFYCINLPNGNIKKPIRQSVYDCNSVGEKAFQLHELEDGDVHYITVGVFNVSYT